MDEAARKPGFWPLDLITFVLICVWVLAIHFKLWDAARLSAGPEQWSNAEYFFSSGFFGPLFQLLLSAAVCTMAWILWVNIGTPRQSRSQWVLAELVWVALILFAVFDIAPIMTSTIVPPAIGYFVYCLIGKKNARLGGRIAVLLTAVFFASSLYQIVSQRLVASDASRVATIATQLDAASFTQFSATRDGDKATASQAAAQTQTLTTQLRAELPSDRSGLRSEVLTRHTALVTTADRARTTIAGVQQAGGADPARLTSPKQITSRLADLRSAENTAMAHVNLLDQMAGETSPAPAESWRPIPAAAVFNR